MENLRFNPESSLVSAPANESKLFDGDDSGKFVSPKARKNILSGMSFKGDCSVKFDLDSTIESELEVTMESSARNILREVNKNRRLISVNIDDTVASLEKTDVSDVSTANVFREKEKARHISLDLDFSLSSKENTASVNLDSTKEESVTPEKSTLSKNAETPDSWEKAEKGSLNIIEEKDQNDDILTSSKVDLLENSASLKNKEAPDCKDKEECRQNVSNQVISMENSQKSLQTSILNQLNNSRDEGVANDDPKNINEGTYTKVSLSNLSDINTSQQMDGTYVLNKSNDKSVQPNNGTFTINEEKRKSVEVFKGSEETKQEVNSPKDSTRKIATVTPLRRSLRNQKSLTDKIDPPQDEVEPSIQNTSEAIGVEIISAPLRRSRRKSFFNQDANDECTKKSSPEKTFEEKGEDRSDHLQSSKRKSISDSIKNFVPRKKPSFDSGSLDYDENVEDLQINSNSIAQHSTDHLQTDKSPSVNASHPKKEVSGAQKEKITNSKLFENTVKEFTPEICSTYIELDCSDNLRSCVSPRSSKMMPSMDLKSLPNCSESEQNRLSKLVINEIEMPLSAEIRAESPLTDLHLSAHSDDLDLNDEPDASKHQENSNADPIPTTEVNENNKLKSVQIEISEKEVSRDKAKTNEEHEQKSEAVDIQNKKPEDPKNGALDEQPVPSANASEKDVLGEDAETANPIKEHEPKSKAAYINDIDETAMLNKSSLLRRSRSSASSTKPNESKGVKPRMQEADIVSGPEDLKNGALEKQPVSSANLLEEDVLGEDAETANLIEEHESKSKGADINEEPEMLEADVVSEPIVPQEAVETENQESSTKKRTSTDLEMEKSKEKTELKEFPIPNVSKKRKTVKTADSRDETVILNKSSLLRRTRSSTSSTKPNESKGVKSINDLSLDSSLELSSIRQVNRKKLIYHSTPVHRTSKRSKIEDAAEGDSSLDISKLSEIPSSENASNQAVARNSSKKEESSKRATRSSTSKSSVKESSARLSSKVSSVKEASARLSSKVSSVKEASARLSSKVSSVKEASVRQNSNVSVKESIRKSQLSNISQNDVSAGVASEVDFEGGTSRMKSSQRLKGNSLRGRFVESYTTYDSSTTLDSFDDTYESDVSMKSSTEPDLIAIWAEKLKKKPSKTTKRTTPKLFMPPKCKWVNKELYQYLEKKLKPKYSLEATKHAEGFVMDLYDLYNRVMFGHTPDLKAVKNKAMGFGICSTELQLSLFIHKFMPFHFIAQFLPIGGAFNSKVPPSSASPFDEL